MRAIVTSSADPQEAADENFDAGTQYLTEDTGDKPDDKGVWEDEVQKPDKHGPMVHGVPQEGTEAQEGYVQPTGGPQGDIHLRSSRVFISDFMKGGGLNIL